MHWVNRGKEPGELNAIRGRYTPRWVAYYPSRIGVRPRDSRWRDFHNDIGAAFAGLCGYCEKTTKGEVDHFRPKSKFPELVYEWANWVFACADCNQKKLDKWPAGGYVDPCARTLPARPEAFFDFDTATGEILTKEGLTAQRRRKALQTIRDLGLNDEHHLKARLYVIALLKEIISYMPDNYVAISGRLRQIIARDKPLSSIARALLNEQGLYP